MAAIYQITTDVHGWWKAKPRTESLVQIFSVSGAQLVATTSFDFRRFREFRQNHGKLYGVMVGSGSVDRIFLPPVAFSVLEDAYPNVSCHRALTAAILCFYDEEVTTDLLRVLIPFALLQLDQGPGTFSFTGALRGNLRSWVISVATEEYIDGARDKIFEEISHRQRNLTGISFERLMTFRRYNQQEDAYSLGF